MDTIYQCFFSENNRSIFTILDIIILLYIWSKTGFSLYTDLYNQNKARSYFFLIFLFCMFSMWASDWYHYLEEFEMVKSYGALHINLESFYIWLIESVCTNYMQFRFIIWGAAVYILYLLFRRISLPLELLIFVFCGIWLIWFSYARVSLAMALIFLGYSLWYKPIGTRKLLSRCIAIAVMCSAFFFHKSAAFGIAVAFFAIASEKFSKKTTIIYLILLPLLVILIRGYIVDFLYMDFDSSENELQANLAAGQRNFTEISSSTKGLGSIIRDFFELAVYYVISYLCLIYSLKKKNELSHVPSELDAFVRICFFLILFASIFAFNLGFNTSTIYRRFILFSFIPCTVAICYFHYYKLFPKITPKVIQLGIIGMFYTIFYSLYCTLLGI